MNRKLLLLFVLAILAVPTFAQKHHGDKNKEDRKKEFLEIKLKFLADEIDLKEDQKKQFEELYSQMEAERRQTFKKIKGIEKKMSEKRDASEADYESAVEDLQKAKDEMTVIEKKYDEKFANFLSKKQLFKLHEAEQKFMERARNCRDKKLKEKK